MELLLINLNSEKEFGGTFVHTLGQRYNYIGGYQGFFNF